MSLFIVLSGFLLTYNYMGQDIESGVLPNIRFSARRIKKFYILHIITMAFIVLCDIYLATKGTIKLEGNTEIIKIILNIFLIKVWVPKMEFFFSLNGSSWYLCVMVVLYFAFPFLHKRIVHYSSRREAWKNLLVVLIIQFGAAFAFSRLELGTEYER